MNLVGDGDDIDLIEAIERSFDISIGDDELRDVRTFGGLYDVVLSHLTHTEEARRTHCRSATAFRRIRRSLRLMGLGEVQPSTLIRDILGRGNHGKILERLECESGLALSATTLAAWTFVFGFAMVAVVWCIALPAASPISSLLASTIAAVFGGLILAGITANISNGWGERLDTQLATVGDLAHRAVHLNFARLKDKTGQNHPTDVWCTLEWLARDVSGCKDQIDRQTLLIG